MPRHYLFVFQLAHEGVERVRETLLMEVDEVIALARIRLQARISGRPLPEAAVVVASGVTESSLQSLGCWTWSPRGGFVWKPDV